MSYCRRGEVGPSTDLFDPFYDVTRTGLHLADDPLVGDVPFGKGGPRVFERLVVSIPGSLRGSGWSQEGLSRGKLSPATRASKHPVPSIHKGSAPHNRRLPGGKLLTALCRLWQPAPLGELLLRHGFFSSFEFAFSQ